MMLKTTGIRVLLYALGVGVGIFLWFCCSAAIAGLGFGASYGMYNGYWLVIFLCIAAGIAAYYLTRGWLSSRRWNLAAFLVGVATFSLLGGISVLVTDPQFLIFWPKG